MVPGENDDVLERLVGAADAVRDGFDELPGPVVLLDGPDHRLLAMNAAYRAFSGRQRVIGWTMREAFPEIESQGLFGVVEHVYDSGDPVHARERWIRFDPGDGERDFCMDFDILPRRRVDGTVHGVLIQQTDVTERVRQRLAAEAAARRAQQRYEVAHDVVLALQRALLPARVPVLPRVDVAARYLVAGTEQSAGGDWFDARVLDDHSVALVVGDVVGHGVAAAATMSQLRAVLADALEVTADPTAAVQRWERFAAGVSGARSTTAVVAVYHPAEGVLDYVTRGHPPPVVVDREGRARQLLGSGGGPLGAVAGGPVQRAVLELGEALVMFSDGLVEPPDRTPVEGVDALLRLLEDVTSADPERTADDLCAAIMGALGGSGNDDATLLVAVRRPPRPGLDERARSDVAGVASLRRGLRDWLLGLRVDPAEQIALEMAVGEAVDNAVDHGHRGRGDGTVAVHAELADDGCAHVRIEDDGAWREPVISHAGRGRGLAVLGSAGEALDVRGGPQGTVVTFRRRLARPVATTAASARAGEDSVDPSTFTTSFDGPAAVLHVTGAVDVLGADELRRELARTTRGGTVSITVDLNGVTHLTSVGVAALAEALHRAEGGGRRLMFSAPTGSPAAYVLDLVGLPRELPSASG